MFVCVGAYRTALRQLRSSVSALESFVSNHLRYEHADDVRMVNSVSVHFNSVVSRLVHATTDIMDRYQLTRRGRLVMYNKLCQCDGQMTEHDVKVLLAHDLSRLLSQIRTASQIISLTA